MVREKMVGVHSSTPVMMSIPSVSALSIPTGRTEASRWMSFDVVPIYLAACLISSHLRGSSSLQQFRGRISVVHESLTVKEQSSL
jgi:hypothetical protein